jgi:hypothetical protein
VISRADVEQAILEEEAMLEQVATLLEHEVELAAWPQDARTALALALEDASMSRAEGWKAVALRRHLFGPEAAMPERLAVLGTPSVLDRRHAERLRSGLLARVRYRIAMYLRTAVA